MLENPKGVRVLLDENHLSPHHRIHHVMNEFTRRRSLILEQSQPPYWDEYYFLFHTTEEYQNTDKKRKRRMLTLANEHVLGEVYGLVKAGMAYAGKMLLASETLEERQIYSFIAADFATHSQWLEHFLEKNRHYPISQYTHYYARLIEISRNNPLNFLFQVLVIGMAIDRLRELSASCLHPQLTEVLQHMVYDYRNHLASGTLLQETLPLRVADKEFLRQSCMKLFAFLQAESFFNVRRLTDVIGPIEDSQLEAVLELMKQASIMQDMNENVVALIKQAELGWLLSYLDEHHGLLQSQVSLRACKQYYEKYFEDSAELSL